MKSRKTEFRRQGARAGGFSLTELVVAMAVALVLMGMGMPYFLRAYHSYQLTNAAQQFADILRLTRYEAIRLNKNVNCVIRPATDPGMTVAFADSNGDTIQDPTEMLILLGNGGGLVDGGGVPGAAGLLTGANVTSVPFYPTAGNAVISFDARGAVIVGGVITANVDVFYLSSAIGPEAGFRAVLLMPSGSIQVWTGDGAGNWGQLR